MLHAMLRLEALTSGSRQLHSAVCALGEEVERGIIRHHEAELHFAEFSTSPRNHQIEVAGCRPCNVAVLMFHSAKVIESHNNMQVVVLIFISAKYASIAVLRLHSAQVSKGHEHM